MDAINVLKKIMYSQRRQKKSCPATRTIDIISVLVLVSAILIPHPLWAHGTVSNPPSRIYSCYQEGPERPKSTACRAAILVGGTQAAYDWNSVNQASAADQHQWVVPNGSLCAGGNSKFRGFDLPRTDWTRYELVPDQANRIHLDYYATAAHATRYFDVYITRYPIVEARSLAWSDLELLCRVDQPNKTGSIYKLSCPLPQGKSGNHILYTVWQRADSPEAFYACNDVHLPVSSVSVPDPNTLPRCYALWQATFWYQNGAVASYAGKNYRYTGTSWIEEGPCIR